MNIYSNNSINIEKINQHIPYTYHICWKQSNTHYYGSEYGKITKIANPKNLWNIYFTSSERVFWFRIFHGEPDIIEIRKTFDNEKDCRKWEHEFLKRFKVIRKNNWLNKTDNIAIYNENVWNKGLTIKDPRIYKYAKLQKNKIISNETKEKLRIAALNRLPMSEETKNKIKNSMKNRIFTKEHRRNLSIAAFRRYSTDLENCNPSNLNACKDNYTSHQIL